MTKAQHELCFDSFVDGRLSRRLLKVDTHSIRPRWPRFWSRASQLESFRVDAPRARNLTASRSHSRDSYIEVDITNQHMTYCQDGRL